MPGRSRAAGPASLHESGTDALSAIKAGLCQGILCEEKDTLQCGADETVGTHAAECCPRCSHLEPFCNQFQEKVRCCGGAADSHRQDLCPDGCEYHETTDYCTALGGLPPCDVIQNAMVRCWAA